MTVQGSTVLAGRYRLEGIIGRGGVADVYRGRDITLGRQVAVKVLRGSSTDEVEAARGRAESQYLAGLNHPGLVTVFDAGVDEGRPFIVMELIDGTSLSSWCSGADLPLESVAEIGCQLADALGYVHAQRLVHRDVKPSNILIEGMATDPGRVRLADFGIALLLDASGLTATGLTVGTAAYLAPEQVRNQPLSGAVDVWALGLVLLECLTGRREYEGPAVEAALARLTRSPQIPDNLPSGWRELLSEMTRQTPEQRPDMSYVATRLRTLANASPTAPLPTGTLPMDVLEVEDDARTSPIDTAPQRTDRLRPRTALFVLLLGMVMAAIVVGGNTGLPTPGPHRTPLPAPSLPGQLGRDLAQLHRAVNP